MSEDKQDLNGIYLEICEQFGMETTEKLFEMFKGQQITFPVHFYSPAKLHEKIYEEYDGSNIRQLAVKYNYSEKTIRRIIKNKK